MGTSVRVRVAVILSISIAGLTPSAFAQTEKRVGLVMGYPTTVGVQWQVSDRFALRADGGFSFGETEQITVSLSLNGVTGGGSTTESRHRTASLGVSGLFTVSRSDQLRLYLAPRAAWNVVHTSFTTEDSGSTFPGGVTRPPTTRSSSLTTNGLGLDGSFGANYRMSDRFAVFGEAGISLISPSAGGSSSSILKSYILSSRGDVGVVIFF
jgi:hypothetical protein